jgi:hypothetical protein
MGGGPRPFAVLQPCKAHAIFLGQKAAKTCTSPARLCTPMRMVAADP